jgi:enoyl-CoA hydratase/carnithine racemase
MIDAEEAFRLGIVNRLCPPDELVATERLLAQQILSHSQEANIKAKVLLRQAQRSSLGRPFDFGGSPARYFADTPRSSRKGWKGS